MKAVLAALALGTLLVYGGTELRAATVTTPPALAYDSFSTFPADWTVKLSSIDPVPFDAGFANASKTFLPGPHSNVSADDARDALRSFRLYGIAAHHYVLGTKQRVDDLSLHTSTITDCATNTITVVDNDRQTYRTFTAPSPSGGGAGAYPHFNVALANTSLGMQTYGTTSAPGFSAHATVVVTAGPGFSSKSTISLRALASTAPSAASICASTAVNGSAQDPSGQAAFFQTLLAGILSNDPHFTVTRTGPPLPIGKLPLFVAIRRTTDGSAKPVTVVTQNGHFRTLGPGDAGLFTVPAGFTRAAGRMQTPN